MKFGCDSSIADVWIRKLNLKLDNNQIIKDF